MRRNYSLYKTERFVNFRQMLNGVEEKYGDRTAFMYKNGGEIKEKTYKEVNEETKSVGTALVAMGLSRANVALVGPNSYEWLNVFLTCIAGSGAIVPIDHELPFDEIVNVIRHSECRAVFYCEELEESFKASEQLLPKVEYYININKNSEKEEGKFLSLEGIRNRGGRLVAFGDNLYTKCRHDTGKMKMLVYTSGTLSNPKGVMLSEKNLIASIYYGLQMIRCRKRCLSMLPDHHTYEAVCGILASLASGATVCINDRLENLMEDFKVYRPDYIFTVPMIVEHFYKRIQRCANGKGTAKALKGLLKVNRGFQKAGFDKSATFFKSIKESLGGELELIICGGAPVSVEIAEFFKDLGIEFIIGYGLTECAALVSVNTERSNDPASVGMILPCIECKINEPDENGVGEICLKGDNIMMGYYKNDIATEAVFEENGYFHTGDMGRLNSKGRLFVTGRKKNVIVLPSGKNVYPEEIEGYLLEIPMIKEAWVHETIDKQGRCGFIGATVFIEEAQVTGLDREEICQKLKEQVSSLNQKLPRYKNIADIKIKSTPFDKTPTQKIRRKA